MRKEGCVMERNRKPLGVIILVVLSLFLAPHFLPSAAQADLVTYNFSGTLTINVDGISTVTGWFTLDTVAKGLMVWDLTLSPVGIEVTRNGGGVTNMSTSNGIPIVVLSFDYPSNPEASVSNLIALGFVGRSISLADLPAIETNPIPVNGSYFTSGVYDNQNGVSSGFSEATLTVAPSAVPIPSTMLFLGSGLVGLVGLRRKFGKERRA
jgi:hypothetical protein